MWLKVATSDDIYAVPSTSWAASVPPLSGNDWPF